MQKFSHVPHPPSRRTARERARWLRHDAHRFLRPDWRRYVQKGSELEAHYLQIERKYRPDQPRVPAGVREGGQWTTEGVGQWMKVGAGRWAVARPTDNIIQVAGHHFVPRGVFKHRDFPEETKNVFSDATTGKLRDTESNRNDALHREYNKAVNDELDAFLKEKGVSEEQTTPELAREFIDRLLDSKNPRIRNLNMRIYMRETMQLLRRRSRGAE